MSSIDDRVVNMQFNNAQFEKGIGQTNASLKLLNDNLKLQAGTKGIDDVQSAANRFSLSNMESAVSRISSHFSIFGAAAFTVVQSLTNSALEAGKKIADAVIDPLVNGSERRAAAIQQAKFQFKGLGLDVTQTMAAANNAVLGTAFSLDQAATAAAQFGASGINAATGLESVLRSVAGVAAQTGSSYDSIAQIFETVAGNGRLMGEQLTQLSSYGVNAAATLAKSLHTTEANVRDMTSKGQISFKMFSDAMNQAFGANAANANQLFSGALANMKSAISRILADSNAAFDVQGQKLNSLRDIFNSLTPVINAIHTAIQPLLGDIVSFQAKGSASFTKVLGSVTPQIIAIFGSLTDIIQRLRLAIGGGFGTIFQPNAVGTATSVADALSRFFNSIDKFLNSNAQTLQRTFAGFFAIIDILGRVVGGVIGMLANLLGFASQGAGSFLDFTASVGDWLVKIDEAIKKGTGLQTFFRVLGDILQVPISLLKTFFGILAAGVVLLSKFDTSGLDKFAEDVKSKFSGLIQLGVIMEAFWHGVQVAAAATWNFIKPLFNFISAAIKAAVSIIGNVLKGMSFDDALQIVNVGLFGSLLIIVKRFTDTLKNIFNGGGGGLVSSIKGVFTALTDNLKALQAKTNADTLIKIAVAVALLAASAVALSMVDTIKLAAALGAIGGLMGGLIGTFAALQKITGTKGTVQLIGIAVTMDLIAGAILVLAGAVAILAALPFDRLSAGVGAIIVLLGALVGTLWSLNEIGPKIILGVTAIATLAPALLVLAGAIAILAAIPFDRLAPAVGALVVTLGALIGVLWSIDKIGPRILLGVAAIAILAPAMVILASAIAILSSIPMANLAQGLGAMVVAMGALVGVLWAVTNIGPKVLIAAAAVGAIAGSIALLAGSVAIFGAMDTGQLIQGMVALAAGMAILVGGILLLSFAGPEVILGSAAMVIAAVAITILAGALKIVATMSWDDIGRTMVVLAGSLILLAAAMLVMGNPLVALGAVALIVAASAMMILAPALKIMGSMSWDDIGRGMTVLAASLLILAAGGLLMIPASVGFLLLGAALLLLGTGVKGIGEGILALATGIGLLVVAGTGGLALMGQAIDVFISKLPALGIGIGGAFVNMVVTIGQQAPQMILAFTNVILAMLASIDQVMPSIIKTGTHIILTLSAAMVTIIPQLADDGARALVKFLDGVSKNLPSIIIAGTNLIIKFIVGIGYAAGKIADAALATIVRFVNSLATSIDKYAPQLRKAGGRLSDAIVSGMTGGLSDKVGEVWAAAQKLVAGIPNAIKNLLHIQSPSKVTRELGQFTGDGIVLGLGDRVDDVSSASEDLGTAAINGLKKSVSGISTVFANSDISSPTIRPVIDLTDVKKSVAQIPGLMPKPSLSLDTSTDVASNVALQEQAKNAKLVIDATETPAPTSTVNFTQNNNSPKALSTTEIYRNTKNQLSTLKEDLGVVDQSGNT